MKKSIIAIATAAAFLGSASLAATAAGTQKGVHVVKASTSYCNKNVNAHTRTSLFPNVKTKAKLDTITCHSDTGYDNDHDFGGKDLTKGDAQ